MSNLLIYFFVLILYSFHVGSGCQDSGAYRTAVASCRQVFDIATEIGFSMDLLDIGGGFPGSKGPYISFEEVSRMFIIFRNCFILYAQFSIRVMLAFTNWY